MRSIAKALLAATLMVGFLALAKDAGACSVCFGDPSSSLVEGAKAGILFLAGVIYVQIMLIGAVAGYFGLRARKLTREKALLAATVSSPERAPKGS